MFIRCTATAMKPEQYYLCGGKEEKRKHNENN